LETAIRYFDRPAAAAPSGDFVSIITLQVLSTTGNDQRDGGGQQCDIAKTLACH
jgi:hypothetical protein